MNTVKEIIKYLLIFLTVILLFSIAMIITYALPNTRIRNNVANSIALLEKDRSPFFNGYEGATLDSFTDSIILNQSLDVAENEGISLTKRAFAAYYNSENNEQQLENLKGFFANEKLNLQQYARYWHGYLIVIRPLLLFMTYGVIRQLNVIIVFMLLVLTSILMAKKLGTKYALSFAISIILMNVFIIPMAIQYMNIYLITLIGTIIVLLQKEEKLKNNLPSIFLILGMVTAFFDLLTYPLLTLGLPLAVAIIRLNNKNELTIKELIIVFIKTCILWGLGYGMTYISKWVIASIFMGKNIIPEAIAQFMFRTGTNEQLSKIDVIIKNAKNYYTKPAILILTVFTVVWIYLIIRHRKENINYKNIVTLLIIALMPYVWYIALSNHSNIHAWFTYRIQAISLFSVLSTMLELIEIKNEAEEVINEK